MAQACIFISYLRIYRPWGTIQRDGIQIMVLIVVTNAYRRLVSTLASLKTQWIISQGQKEHMHFLTWVNHLTEFKQTIQIFYQPHNYVSFWDCISFYPIILLYSLISTVDEVQVSYINLVGITPWYTQFTPSDPSQQPNTGSVSSQKPY